MNFLTNSRTSRGDLPAPALQVAETLAEAESASSCPGRAFVQTSTPRFSQFHPNWQLRPRFRSSIVVGTRGLVPFVGHLYTKLEIMYKTLLLDGFCMSIWHHMTLICLSPYHVFFLAIFSYSQTTAIL